MITINLEIFVHTNIGNKNFRVKNLRTLTSLRNYLYNEIFLTKKELVHVSLIRSTTAEEYQHQSKQARSTCTACRLPHKANNHYGGGTYTCILHVHCILYIYYTSMCIIIHCRKYYAVLHT